MSEMSNTEEREDTACIEITCSVKVTKNVILLLMWEKNSLSLRRLAMKPLAKGRAIQGYQPR